MDINVFIQSLQRFFFVTFLKFFLTFFILYWTFFYIYC